MQEKKKEGGEESEKDAQEKKIAITSSFLQLSNKKMMTLNYISAVNK